VRLVMGRATRIAVLVMVLMPAATHPLATGEMIVLHAVSGGCGHLVRLRGGGARAQARERAGGRSASARGRATARARGGHVQKRSVLCQARAAYAHAVVGGGERGRCAASTALGAASKGCDGPSGFFDSRPAPASRVWEVEWRGSDESGGSGSSSLEDTNNGKDGSGDDTPGGRPIRDGALIEARRDGVAACEAMDVGRGDGDAGDYFESGSGGTAQSAFDVGGAPSGNEDEDADRTWRDQNWPLDLNGVLALYHHLNETLMLEAGEYQLSSLVWIEKSARIGYAPPEDANSSRLITESVKEATAMARAEKQYVQENDGGEEGSKIVQQQMVASEGIVVRLWGAWSMGAASSGSIRRIGMVSKTDTDEEPTLEIQGVWLLEWCALRSVGGTGVLGHGEGVLTIASCAIGSMPRHAPAVYGLTATDACTCTVSKSTFQRCVAVGAQFLRLSNGTLVDCNLESCKLGEGARLSRSKVNAPSHPKSDGMHSHAGV
jgi:hypothetical protein